MKYSKEALNNMEFNDKFEKEENEEDICFVCGSDSDILVGYNENEQMHKYECANCGAIYIIDKGSEERILLKGEERDWEKYLSENLEFPFIAEITEISDREFFDPDDPGPVCFMDHVKVIEVFESDRYGIMAVIKKGRAKHVQILAFMEAVDDDSRNYVEIENYKRWRDIYWLSPFLVTLIEALRGNP